MVCSAMASNVLLRSWPLVAASYRVIPTTTECRYENLGLFRENEDCSPCRQWLSLQRFRFRRVYLGKHRRTVETELAGCGDDERPVIRGKADGQYLVRVLEARDLPS